MHHYLCSITNCDEACWNIMLSCLFDVVVTSVQLVTCNTETQSVLFRVWGRGPVQLSWGRAANGGRDTLFLHFPFVALLPSSGGLVSPPPLPLPRRSSASNTAGAPPSPVVATAHSTAPVSAVLLHCAQFFSLIIIASYCAVSIQEAAVTD